MAFTILPLMAIAATALAGPIASAAQQPRAASSPSPTATKPPTLVLRDGPVITTIPVSSCYNYADPHAGSTGIDGCSCDGYDDLLPRTSIDDTLRDYSAVTTAIETTVNGFPFTRTMSNEAIVAYASTTIYPGGGVW
ncbi:hypothetical protein LTR78_000501 [Recurvomyces mirabilis]|uniref:Uncharacterized protein n=1 Tax=Recurvomyces mirabilis TaxID=574656 RepID=A0AAE0WY24_9PEZI|nr:hypothetical protein LTR78_000501 [Recurvomyces mirabilis]KAK5162156.1 hypothetical protein LTS14_000502 [Recurvomyces mirabilis]